MNDTILLAIVLVAALATLFFMSKKKPGPLMNIPQENEDKNKHL
jgi:hypothetical protein